MYAPIDPAVDRVTRDPVYGQTVNQGMNRTLGEIQDLVTAGAPLLPEKFTEKEWLVVKALRD